MAYVVALVSAWLVFSAATALRPGRRGIFAALAFPVGWAAGELAVQALVVEAALVGLLRWWGWPRTAWLGWLVTALALCVAFENLALIAISFAARSVVRRAMAKSAPPAPHAARAARGPLRVLVAYGAADPACTRARCELVRNVGYGPEARAPPRRVARAPHRRRRPGDLLRPRRGVDLRRQARAGASDAARVRGARLGRRRVQLPPRAASPLARPDRGRHAHPRRGSSATSPTTAATRTASSSSGGSAGGHLAALVALAPDDPAWRPADLGDVEDWSVRGAMPFYGVLEMTGDEEHWHGLGRGLRSLLETRVVQPALRGPRGPLPRAVALRAHHARRAAVPGGPGRERHPGRRQRRARLRRRAFARGALAPIYYVELPFTQHAFDMTASPRTSATTRAAVAFASSVDRTRARRSRRRWCADYQVPPTELLVEVDAGEWVGATEVARATRAVHRGDVGQPVLGRQLDDAANDERRARVASTTSRAAASRTRDAWRATRGALARRAGLRALRGVDVEFVRAPGARLGPVRLSTRSTPRTRCSCARRDRRRARLGARGSRRRPARRSSTSPARDAARGREVALRRAHRRRVRPAGPATTQVADLGALGDLGGALRAAHRLEDLADRARRAAAAAPRRRRARRRVGQGARCTEPSCHQCQTSSVDEGQRPGRAVAGGPRARGRAWRAPSGSGASSRRRRRGSSPARRSRRRTTRRTTRCARGPARSRTLEGRRGLGDELRRAARAGRGRAAR